LKLSKEEWEWLKINCPYLSYGYRHMLMHYRFSPSEVECSLDENNQLHIHIEGLWWRTILWEVPLMAIVSELYFQLVDTDWKYDSNEYQILTKEKANTIAHPFVEFGTRRRRSYQVQDDVVKVLKDNEYCKGTSNVYLAYKYGMTAIGTQAHELCMALAVLESANHPNKVMLQKWMDYYHRDLSIALTDTYGTDSFLQDFNDIFALAYQGVRHDSGSPYEFTDKVVSHYKKLGIDHTKKLIVFSDGLDANECVKIRNYCHDKIQCVFGIGTHFSNDKNYFGKALNIVIKLREVNGEPAVKLSDSPTKAIGDPSAVRVMKWIHFGTPLDVQNKDKV